MPARQYLSCFNLVGELQTKLVRSLSGGERNRVHLARNLCRGMNVLLLDEPTNDLDLDTLRSLENAITEFDGCAVVVSHDRYFLDRTATHLLVFHGPGGAGVAAAAATGTAPPGAGVVQWFEGSYGEYMDWVAAQSADTRRANGLYVLPGTSGGPEEHKTVKM